MEKRLRLVSLFLIASVIASMTVQTVLGLEWYDYVNDDYVVTTASSIDGKETVFIFPRRSVGGGRTSVKMI